MAKVAIFDFDGTLADSFDTLIDMIHTVTNRGPKLDRADITMLRGMALEDILKQLHIRKWRLPYLLFKGRKAMAGQMDTIRPFKNIPDMLEQLARQGYKIYILSTNHTANINRFLQLHHMEHYFTGVLGNIGLLGKARALRKLMKRNGYTVNDCIYVGDETRDIEAAHKVGVRCVAVTWGFNNAHALKKFRPYAMADSPADITRITWEAKTPQP